MCDVFGHGAMLQCLPCTFTRFAPCTGLCIFYTSVAVLSGQGRPTDIAVAFLVGGWLVSVPASYILSHLVQLVRARNLVWLPLAPTTGGACLCYVACSAS